MPDRWYLFDKQGDTLEIHICGEIDAEHSGGFFSELSDHLPAKEISLHLNSPGGCAFTGTAIYNRLAYIAREGTPIRAYVEGICSSAASIIAMSAQEISIPEAGFMHVHMPTGEDKRLVDLFSETFVRIFSNRTSRSRDEVATLLANGTWMSGREAIWERLADTIVGQS